ncbi:MAG: DUF1592 domain-containing protein, partial [Pirellulaceae bacterium]|nr:DUF1592 domain-containing protein [Pirellulaceae bacterium]
LPPLLLEKYVAAAEKLAQASIAIVDPDKAPSQLREKEQLKPSGAANLTDYGVYSMYSQGGVRGGFRAPRDGDYLIRVAAGADQAGPEVAKVRVTVNGQKLRDIEVKAKRDDLDSYEIAWKGKRGALAISAEFINDYYQPKNPDPKLRGDRNLYVRSINLVGPLNNRPTDLPESHKRLVIATPNAGTTLEQASERVLRPLLQRAFRRKVTPDEVRAYQRFVKLANERGASYEEALRVALTAVLVSPHFLFRVETDPQPDDPQAAHDLAQYELASRLSYFLWSSMPDDQLFALATAGKLNDENVLESQVKRMLADEKAWAFVENFGGQWLNLRNLEEVSPDPNQFRTFNSALRRDMAKETLLFFEHVMREDRSVVEFIDGRYTFVNQRLASHYGMPNVVGDEFRRVALQGDRRAGVLTHASILTITSNPTRTSPVMRGKWILENILNDPPPDPPDNVPEFLAAQKASPNATLREQLELHRKNANCAVCHIKMDALGFGFENFDPIGRWRDQDGGKPIDSSGELPGGGKFSGPNELVQILKKSKARFCRSLTEKTLTYALGRGIEYYDRCAVDDVVSRLEQNDYRFSALVTGVVLSEPFRRRRGDRGENQ